MTELTSDDVLQHYGIKGMRWGKRKSLSNDSTSTSKNADKPKSTPSEDHEVATQLRKKKVSEMSNAELKRINERLQLETQYSQLTQKAGSSSGSTTAKATLIKGRNILKNTLAVADTANKVITTINSPAAKEVRKLIGALT